MFTPSAKTFPDLVAPYKTLTSSPMRTEEGEAVKDLKSKSWSTATEARKFNFKASFQES